MGRVVYRVRDKTGRASKKIGKSGGLGRQATAQVSAVKRRPRGKADAKKPGKE